MSFSLQDLQSLLDSRLTDLKEAIFTRMDTLDDRLTRVEDHVQKAAGDKAIIEMLERRVSVLEAQAKENTNTAFIAKIAQWLAATAGAALVVNYVT